MTRRFPINPMSVVRPWGMAGFMVAAAGCGGGAARDAAPSRDTAVVAAPTTAAAPDTGCRKEWLWQWCSVLDRLERAGVVLTAIDDAPPDAALHGDRRVFRVGARDDELHLFLYPTVEGRRADTDRLDSATVAPPGERRATRVPPLLVTSNNLAAIVLTLNERTSERLANALSAGLPQPRP